MSRNNAGSDVDPGMIQQAARQVPAGPQPGQAVTRILPARGPRPAPVSVPDKDAATAATPVTIPNVNTDFFGPLNPLVPTAPANARARALDYLTGWNITTNNNRGGQMDVRTLRNLARNCDLVNIAVDRRKDQLEAGNFDFKLRDDKLGFQSKKDPRIQELRDFFRFPDKRRPLARWIRKWSDDVLVADQPCIWIQRNRAGKPYQMRVIDTATIKPLIDGDGEIPLAGPGDAVAPPAFQQWLKGVPSSDYAAANGDPDAVLTWDEMLWHPRNPRPDTLFGWSPVEQIILTVNQAIRRQLLILAGYTEGTVPEALVPVPADWNLDQIAAFQLYWNELLAGKYGDLRGLRFLPGGMEKAVFTKRWDDHGEYDEWLARVVSEAFRLPSTWAVKSNNRATAGQTSETSNDEGRIPYLSFICEVMNLLVWRGWGYLDIECVFHDSTTSDELKAAQAVTERISSAQTTMNEERGAAGRDPYADPAADKPLFLTATGPVDIAPPEPAAEPEPGAAGVAAPGQVKLPAAKPDDLAQTVAKMVQDELAKAGKKKRF